MSKELEVILIDDDRCTLEMHKVAVKTVLAAAEVHAFLSARAALEYLRNKDLEDLDADTWKGVIVSDLHMPVVDGFQFLDEFALLPRGLRNRYAVFILSADADTVDERQLIKKPDLAGFLSKPLTIKKFTTLLRKAGYSDRI